GEPDTAVARVEDMLSRALARDQAELETDVLEQPAEGVREGELVDVLIDSGALALLVQLVEVRIVLAKRSRQLRGGFALARHHKRDGRSAAALRGGDPGCG